MRRLMTEAREAGARLIHFPEGALSGYVKSQILAWSEVDWRALRGELETVAAHAGRLGLWTVLGCNHRLTPPNWPHNSLYVISDAGVLVGRYDKRFCSNTELRDWYTPGVAPLVFEIDSFKFGAALCIEIYFPQLFLEYEALGVDCVLLSTYSGGPMTKTLARAHAATNAYWLSVSTTAQPDGPSSGVIGPDGHYLAEAWSNGRATLACGEINRADAKYEIELHKARPWRAMSRRGEIYQSRQVRDARSEDRLSFLVP